jgi:LTXXQ motif family protein
MIKQTMRFFAAGAALSTALLVSAPAQAQQGQPNRPRQEQQDARGNRQDRLERRVAQLTERLSLSADQAAQIRRILEEERTQMQALRPSRGEARTQGQARPEGQARPRDGERRQPSAEVTALRERTQQRVEAVLNDGQRARYRELRQEMESRRGEGRQAPGQARTR